MSNDVGQKTRKSLYWNVSLKLPYEVFRFATSIIVARILEPKDFGIVSIATMTIYYSNTITNFGFNQALVQRKDITDRHINSVFTFDLAISLCLASLFYVLAPSIAEFFNSPESKNVIKALSVVFVLTTLHDLPYTLLRRGIDFRTIALTDTVQEVSMSLLTLGLAVLGYRYWAIVFGHLIPLFFATVYLLIKVRMPRISYHHDSLKELFSFGFWSFINMQVYFFSTRIDRLIIGRVLTPSILGLYDKAKSLQQMPSEGIGVNITTVLFSSFSRAQHSRDELKNMLRKGLLIVSAINFPIYLGLYAVAPHFVLVLLGEKWRGMIPALQILSIAGLFISLERLLYVGISGAGDYRRGIKRGIFATCVFAVVSLLLVRFGIDAVAIGVVLSSIVGFYLMFDLAGENFDFHWRDLLSCTLPVLISALVMFSAVKAGIVLFFKEPTALNLLGAVTVGAVAYAVPLMFIPSALLNEIRGSVYSDCNKVWVRVKSFFGLSAL